MRPDSRLCTFFSPKKKFEKNSKVLQTRAASLACSSAVLALKVHCDFLGCLRKFEDVFEIGIPLSCIVPKISLQLNLCCAAKLCLGVALTSGFLRFRKIFRIYGEKLQSVPKQRKTKRCKRGREFAVGCALQLKMRTD